MNCFRVYRKLITWWSHAKSLLHQHSATFNCKREFHKLVYKYQLQHPVLFVENTMYVVCRSPKICPIYFHKLWVRMNVYITYITGRISLGVYHCLFSFQDRTAVYVQCRLIFDPWMAFESLNNSLYWRNVVGNLNAWSTKCFLSRKRNPNWTLNQTQ